MFISAEDVVPSFKGFTLIMVSKVFAFISISASSSSHKQTHVILCMLHLSNIELLIIVSLVHSLQSLLETWDSSPWISSSQH